MFNSCVGIHIVFWLLEEVARNFVVVFEILVQCDFGLESGFSDLSVKMVSLFTVLIFNYGIVGYSY